MSWRPISRATRSSRASSSSTSSSTRPISTRSCRRGEMSDFLAELAASTLHPLWDRFKTLTPIRPQAKDPPLIWRWRDIEPFTARAVSEVPIDDVERRALIMVNPAFAGETVTTSNLIAAFTVLDPGDRARPHRHTFAAIRFATRADGATTIVNGRRCDMREGALILTPALRAQR